MQLRRPARSGSAAVRAASCALVSGAMLLAVAGGPSAAAEDPTTGTPAPVAPPGSGVETGPGPWTVVPAGNGSWQVTWRSPRRFPVVSDRPTLVTRDPALQVVGAPTVADDGRSVTATVAAAAAPDPADLDVVLSGRSLTDPRAALPRTPGRWVAPDRRLLQDDPAEPGTLPVRTRDYRLADLDLPGLAEPVEMVGHVVEPDPAVTDGPFPLVLFLHGRHPYCYSPAQDRLTFAWPCRPGSRPVPSQLGYDYIQRRLAGQGFVTVSIAANGINAQDAALPDGGAGARSALVQAHLDQWAQWARDQSEDVDLDRVVLVGHSRGGEGVARAALEIPRSAAYRVAGLALIAPTDFAGLTVPYVPTVTVLPSCDGDVVDLQGQTYTDAGRDLVADDTGLRSSVFVVGANHNFFNTEWTPSTAAAPAQDDWQVPRGACARRSDTRLTAAEQRRVGRAYVAGAVRLFTEDATAFLPLFDGSAVRVASTGDAVALSHDVGSGRVLRRPGVDATADPGSAAAVRLCQGTTALGLGAASCGRGGLDPTQTPHWPAAGSLVPVRQALEAQWQTADSTARLQFTAPLDLSAARALDLRTVVDPRLGNVTLDLRIQDGSGAAVTVAPAGGRLIPALPRGPVFYRKLWAQTVRVDVAGLSGVDLTDVTAVTLVPRSDAGRVWVLDAAAVPQATPAVPDRRVPLLDLGRVVVDEGDGPQAVQVPFTLDRPLATEARIAVWGVDDASADRPRRRTVTIPAGATGGFVSWPVSGDTRDDTRQWVTLVAHPLADVVVRDGQGAIVVRDDDPPPGITVRRIGRGVSEGGVAAWRIRLSRISDAFYPVALAALPATSGPRSVSAADLAPRWRRAFVDGCRSSEPLWRCRISWGGFLEPGTRSSVVRVPVATDGVAEPRESLRLEVRIRGAGRFPVSTVVRASR